MLAKYFKLSVLNLLLKSLLLFRLCLAHGSFFDEPGDSFDADDINGVTHSFAEPLIVENAEQVGQSTGSGDLFQRATERMKRVLNKYKYLSKARYNVPVDTATMSDEEVRFHYFQTLDLDKDNKVDGTELVKQVLRHVHSGGEIHVAGYDDFTDEQLERMIDPILTHDDLNKDGMIEYSEFRISQRILMRSL